MTAKRRPYKTYPKAFKLEALRLMAESDQPASEIAMQLGIRRNQLYKWKQQISKKDDAVSSKRGRPKKEEQSELSRLRAENARLKEDVEILKKAAKYFAREPYIIFRTPIYLTSSPFYAK